MNHIVEPLLQAPADSQQHSAATQTAKIVWSSALELPDILRWICRHGLPTPFLFSSVRPETHASALALHELGRSLTPNLDPEAVGALLKLWIECQPEPLLDVPSQLLIISTAELDSTSDQHSTQHHVLSQLSPLKFTDLHVLLCFLQQYCFKHPDIDQQLQAVSVEFGRLLLPAACGAGSGSSSGRLNSPSKRTGAPKVIPEELADNELTPVGTMHRTSSMPESMHSTGASSDCGTVDSHDHSGGGSTRGLFSSDKPESPGCVYLTPSLGVASGHLMPCHADWALIPQIELDGQLPPPTLQDPTPPELVTTVTNKLTLVVAAGEVETAIPPSNFPPTGSAVLTSQSAPGALMSVPSTRPHRVIDVTAFLHSPSSDVERFHELVCPLYCRPQPYLIDRLISHTVTSTLFPFGAYELYPAGPDLVWSPGWRGPGRVGRDSRGQRRSDSLNGSEEWSDLGHTSAASWLLGEERQSSDGVQNNFSGGSTPRGMTAAPTHDPEDTSSGEPPTHFPVLNPCLDSDTSNEALHADASGSLPSTLQHMHQHVKIAGRVGSQPAWSLEQSLSPTKSQPSLAPQIEPSAAQQTDTAIPQPGQHARGSDSTEEGTQHRSDKLSFSPSLSPSNSSVCDDSSDGYVTREDGQIPSSTSACCASNPGREWSDLGVVNGFQIQIQEATGQIRASGCEENSPHLNSASPQHIQGVFTVSEMSVGDLESAKVQVRGELRDIALAYERVMGRRLLLQDKGPLFGSYALYHQLTHALQKSKGRDGS